MRGKYDVVYIGSGISSMISAYKLSTNSDLRILIIEKGKDLIDRKCPIKFISSGKCISCDTCSIMNGVAGAGAFSDGKFTLTTEYGGWLNSYLEDKEVYDLINQVKDILYKFYIPTEYNPSDKWKKICKNHKLTMKQGVVAHFGTDGNYITMKYLEQELKRHNVEILTHTEVVDVIEENNEVKILTDTPETIYANKVVFAVGRSGSQWFQNWCVNNNIPVYNNQVDVGVRVELPRNIWSKISKDIYEPKILNTTKHYNDSTRMFCFNDGGEVVIENTDGILTINGHANSDQSKKTNLSNFALLSTIKFTEPFTQPIDYVKHVSKLANMITNGSVIVQRFGDLIKGRRTNEERLKNNSFQPSLKGAVPGDLSLCLPKRQLDNIIETIKKLDRIAHGTADKDTLLYGIEAKYYSARPLFIDNDFRISERLYAIGDGSGVTRSLSQAGAQGLYVANSILGGN